MTILLLRTDSFIGKNWMMHPPLCPPYSFKKEEKEVTEFCLLCLKSFAPLNIFLSNVRFTVHLYEDDNQRKQGFFFFSSEPSELFAISKDLLFLLFKQKISNFHTYICFFLKKEIKKYLST
jgi:hypothetical protein